MIKLIGIPYDGNSSSIKGSSLGPSYIRLIEKGDEIYCFSEFRNKILNQKNFIDLGDMSFSDIKPKKVYHQIKNKIKQELGNNSKIICFGGDHSISFPIIESYAEKFNNLNVLHLDAHPDLYDDFDNNPYSDASPFARIMEKRIIKSLTQVGIRTLNPKQKKQADKFNVNIIEMKNFNFNFIKTLKKPLYISIDLDVLDPAFAPGVSCYEPGGISTRELITIIQKISVPIVGADIVELNPKRDLNNMTSFLAYKLFKELVEKMI